MTTSIVTGEHKAAEADGAWAELSAQLTQAADADLFQADNMYGWPGRDDVIVTIAPGAGGEQGAACFIPGIARVEINGSLLEVPPERIDATDEADRDRIPATWGLLTHEAAHVRFTTWLDDAHKQLREAVKAGVKTAENASRILDAALLLEEPRIEAQQTVVRPDDIRWLRCSAAKHIMSDLTEDQANSSAVAVNTLALIGGRQAAGIILPSEGNTALAMARRVLQRAKSRVDDYTSYRSDYWTDDASDSFGGSRAARLLSVVREVITYSHPSAATMIRLAQQWLSYLPDNIDANDGKLSPTAKGLLDEVRAFADEIRKGGGHIPSDDGDHDPARFIPLGHTRATGQQKAAAAKLAEKMLNWLIPERTSRRVSELLPPGRLSTREAMRADADEARGVISEARPWQRIKHRTIPTPPLRVGMVLDVSGSMTSVEKQSWEIGFRFATAFASLPDSTLQVWLAGQGTARAKMRPGMVPHFSYGHGCERVDLAIAKVMGSLGLLRRNNARLLIVVTDAGFTGQEKSGSISRVQELLRSGCRVLWLDVSDRQYGMSQSCQETIDAIQAAGATYLECPGTAEAAAELAEGELVRLMHDAAVDIRKNMRRI